MTVFVVLVVVALFLFALVLFVRYGITIKVKQADEDGPAERAMREHRELYGD